MKTIEARPRFDGLAEDERLYLVTRFDAERLSFDLHDPRQVNAVLAELSGYAAAISPSSPSLRQARPAASS